LAKEKQVDFVQYDHSKYWNRYLKFQLALYWHSLPIGVIFKHRPLPIYR
jgi:hypothetical protein